jgi:hypothetical protein
MAYIPYKLAQQLIVGSKLVGHEQKLGSHVFKVELER